MYLLGAAAALFGLDQCLKQLVEGAESGTIPQEYGSHRGKD